MSLSHQSAICSELLKAGSVSRADTSLDAKITFAVLDVSTLCTATAPNVTQQCFDEVQKFGASLNSLSLSDRQAIEQAQTAAKKAIDAIYRKAFNGQAINLDTCLARLKACQTEANVQADTQGIVLEKNQSLALTCAYDDAQKIKSLVASCKLLIDEQAKLGMQLVDSNRKCGNTFNSTNTDGHPGRKILRSGSDSAASEDQAPSDTQQEQTPTAEPVVTPNEEVAPIEPDLEPNKPETESAPNESEQESAANETDDAESSPTQAQSYDRSIANNKSAINTVRDICESKILQQVHAIVAQLKEKGITLDLAAVQAAKANVKKFVREQELDFYQHLITKIQNAPDLEHDAVQFGLIEELVTYINQLSPEGASQLRGIGIDHLLPKDEELPSNDGKGTGTRRGRKAKGETLRKPKSFYEAKLKVKHNGELIEVTARMPRNAFVFPVKALAGLICSQVLGPEFSFTEAEISLEYEASTEEHKVKSFDYKVVPADDRSALTPASDAEPDSGATDISGTTDSAINEEQRSPGQLPIGFTPCPGTNTPIGAFIASILVFMNYGITFNASSQIMYRRSHGHDYIYNWLKFLNQVFFAPWAEAIRNLFPRTQQQMHDENTLTVASQAVEALGRRHLYFLESRGILLNEFNQLRAILVTCTYAGGRGFSSLMPIISRLVGKNPKGKSVITDAYKVYDKILKILGVGKHQVCLIHFMRTFVAALKGVFESMGEVDKDRKLSEQKKIERMQSLIESNSAIFNLCYGLFLLGRIFHIDWDPVFDLPIDELFERNKKIASLRGGETLRELFDLLKACILNLDAAELNDKGVYVGKSGALGATAATFFLNNEDKLRTFLDDLFASKSTNDVERIVKRIFLRLKLIDYRFMGLDLIETFANFGTIAATLEANKIDPFTGICEMYDLAYNAGLLGFAYDRMVVRYIHDGEQTICTQLRDVQLDDPDTGFQNWSDEAALYMLDHHSMKGYKELLMPQLYDKLTYSKRLAAMEAAKEAKKEQSTDTTAQTSKNNVPASAKDEAA